MKAKQTISAKEGRGFINGEEIINGVKFELVVEKEKVEVKRLGNRVTGNKAVGMKVTGNITEYHATSRYAKMLKQYKATGEDVYFTLMGVVDDKGSGRGTERIVAYDCNIDSATILNIDAEGELIKDEVPFTAEDWDIQQTLTDSF